MPRVKTKPHPYRPLPDEKADSEPGLNDVEHVVKPSQLPSNTPISHSNNSPVPVTNVVGALGCFPSLQTMTVLSQSTTTTRTPVSITAPLVSSTIVPSMTPLRLAFPTISTLSIDCLSPLIWPGTQSPLDVKRTPEPSQVPETMTDASIFVQSTAKKGVATRSRAGKRDRELTNCTVCGKIMRRGSIPEHMDRHNNSGRFECPTCGKTFSRASAREKHVRIHTGEKPYRCPRCPKAYRQQVHLNEHMRSHTGNRPFRCHLCGFSLATKSLLNRHLRTHGIRQDTATVDQRFNPDTANLPTATTTLSGAELTAGTGLWRKHECDQCQAGFSTPQALRSHRMITHGILPSYPCPMCDQTFRSNKARKQHLRDKHPQFCPVCSKQMAQRRRWFLEAHVRDEHPDVCAADVIGPSPLTKFRRKRLESHPVTELQQQQQQQTFECDRFTEETGPPGVDDTQPKDPVS